MSEYLNFPCKELNVTIIQSNKVYIYIYIYIFFGPVKPELGVIPSGQEIIHE